MIISRQVNLLYRHIHIRYELNKGASSQVQASAAGSSGRWLLVSGFWQKEGDAFEPTNSGSLKRIADTRLVLRSLFLPQKFHSKSRSNDGKHNGYRWLRLYRHKFHLLYAVK